MKKIGFIFLTLMLSIGLLIGCGGGGRNDDEDDDGDDDEITLLVSAAGTPNGKVLYLPLDTLGNKLTNLAQGGLYRLTMSISSSESFSGWSGGAVVCTSTWKDYSKWFDLMNIKADTKYDITCDITPLFDSNASTQVFFSFPSAVENFYITIYQFKIEVLEPGLINWTVTANGKNSTETTTELTFKFVEDPGVSIAGSKITIEDVTGEASFTQATLTGNDTRTLDITVAKAGVLTVSIDQEGVVTGPKVVIVHKVGEESNNFPTPTKFMSITIDDGPQPISKEMLDTLDDLGIKATFYINGQNIVGSATGITPVITVADVNARKALVLRMHNDGHEVGNHTQHHKNLSNDGGSNNTALSIQEIRNEIKLTHDLIEEITGKAPKTFRAPFLGYGTNLTSVVKEAAFNYPIIGVDLDTNDWQVARTVNDMANDVIKSAKDGSIILVHDHWDSTDFRSIDAIKLFVPLLRAEGYGFLTIVDLADQLGVTFEAGKQYDNIKETPK